MRARRFLLVATVALGACRHLPPDREARAALPPPPAAVAPSRAEIRGAWFAGTVRGALGEIGHAGIYVFGEDGRYTGCLVGPAECVPIAGTWALRDGRLSLDEGAVEFDALLREGRLELAGPAAYLELVPIPAEPPLAPSGADRTVDAAPPPSADGSRSSWHESPLHSRS